MVLFALGLMVGYGLESWFWCCGGGFALIIFGFLVMRRNG